mmetsp:Transcript_15467/g.25288  ORF Transcript_15467/g.25288 Transcript_15467/m.25288 type:complete len:658 (-) Transcript_15467:1080-3053(-)
MVSGFVQGSLVGVFAGGLAVVGLFALQRRREQCAIHAPEAEDVNDRLGPPPTDARYELNLVGKVDRIYEAHGPKPFEFNEEVVKVFDDMVSRSVPLYCEVIDLLLYWVHKYYQPGTNIYDLGCSTGTTLEVIARSFSNTIGDGSVSARFVGIDNSSAMVKECQKKLAWASKKHTVDIHLDDILTFPITNASFVIMNYTLQFIPIAQRYEMLRNIFQGLAENGVVFISEKVRSDDAEYQETCTWIYEDFKERRGYSKRYIARKKDALMNVLVPFTEAEMKGALNTVGFEHVEILAKWNNFTTFVARKTGMVRRIGKNQVKEVKTPSMDALFEYCPVYLSDYLSPLELQSLCKERINVFSAKGGLGAPTLASFDNMCKLLLSLPELESKNFVVDTKALIIGDPDELTPEQYETWMELVHLLKPWKKGPLNLFGVEIDTEWRSDLKWDRIVPHLPPIQGKVVCDLGCGNGYFMYRMLEFNPKLVVGIDPNPHAWLEFKTFQRFADCSNVHLEMLRGESMDMFPDMFDVVFCLGVLYHTNDPIGMLRKIYKSMRKGSHLIVDCQGIPGDESVALFPRKKYANMGGVYFLPTILCLQNWLARANFGKQEIFFSEPLKIEEQRVTEWAPVNTSLQESLDPEDPTKTIEGYPAPHRYYIRAKRG